MQTLDFTRGLQRIFETLKIAELQALLLKWLTAPANQTVSDQEKDLFSQLMLDSHSGYDRLSTVETMRQILLGLGLQSLYQPARLRRTMSAVSNAANVSNLRGQDFIELFEMVKAVTSLNTTCRNLLEVQKIAGIPPGMSVLEVQVIDYDGAGIEPARLRVSISVLEDMHANLARLHGMTDDKLTFRYFDSGSDLIMAIQAAAVVIASMGTLLLHWWDKGKFRRQETFMKDVEAMSKGLEFLEKAKESVEKGLITPEEATNLKVRVFQDANKLIGLGVMLPLKDTEVVDQRQLLIDRRDTKLLVAGKPETTSEQPPEQAPNPIDSGSGNEPFRAIRLED